MMGISHQNNVNRYAVTENDLLSTFLDNILNEVPRTATVGVIVTKESLKQHIEQKIKGFAEKLENRVQVLTVHNCKNVVEKDVIIIGFAERTEIAFISSLNRMNIAMTRAKNAVYIVGRNTFYFDDVSITL